jgi:hypothetical protein
MNGVPFGLPAKTRYERYYQIKAEVNATSEIFYLITINNLLCLLRLNICSPSYQVARFRTTVLLEPVDHTNYQIQRSNFLLTACIHGIFLGLLNHCCQLWTELFILRKLGLIILTTFRGVGVNMKMQQFKKVHVVHGIDSFKHYSLVMVKQRLCVLNDWITTLLIDYFKYQINKQFMEVYVGRVQDYM